MGIIHMVGKETPWKPKKLSYIKEGQEWQQIWAAGGRGAAELGL